MTDQPTPPSLPRPAGNFLEPEPGRFEQQLSEWCLLTPLFRAEQMLEFAEAHRKFHAAALNRSEKAIKTMDIFSFNQEQRAVKWHRAKEYPPLAVAQRSLAKLFSRLLGLHTKPVGWAVIVAGGYVPVFDKAQADEVAKALDGTVIELFAAPVLEQPSALTALEEAPEPTVASCLGRDDESESNGSADHEKACKATFDAYSAAYQIRYRVLPVNNSRVSTNIAAFVQRIGETEAPLVAAFFVMNINEQYAALKCHSTELLLRDAETYRTQWAMNKAITMNMARCIDGKNEKNLSEINELNFKSSKRIAQPNAKNLLISARGFIESIENSDRTAVDISANHNVAFNSLKSMVMIIEKTLNNEGKAA